jgi:hypothetical protein
MRPNEAPPPRPRPPRAGIRAGAARRSCCRRINLSPRSRKPSPTPPAGLSHQPGGAQDHQRYYHTRRAPPGDVFRRHSRPRHRIITDAGTLKLETPPKRGACFGRYEPLSFPCLTTSFGAYAHARRHGESRQGAALNRCALLRLYGSITTYSAGQETVAWA